MRLWPLFTLAAPTFLLAACGGGTHHIAEITPVVSQRLSGPWVLDETESDDPEEALRRAPGLEPGAQGGRPGGTGGRPGGGMQPPSGGRPGGGMTGGRGGMPGGGAPGGRPTGRRSGPSLSPEEMTALRRMAMAPARNLEISLADSLVVISAPRAEPWLLPFGGKVERELSEAVKVEARAEWEEGRVVVTRKISGGEVREAYMPSVDGERLTVAVSFSPGGRGEVEFQRVYKRPVGGQPRR